MANLKKEVIEKIKKLRGFGLTYKAISLQIGVAQSTVLYWLNERYRNQRRAVAKEKSRNLNPEERKIRYKKRYPYNKKYIMDRYKSDKNFRERFIQLQIKSFKKRKKNWVINNLCTNCGRKREDQNFVMCEHCRIKRRIQAHRKKNEKKRD